MTCASSLCGIQEPGAKSKKAHKLEVSEWLLADEDDDDLLANLSPDDIITTSPNPQNNCGFPF
jgi:hypothetical protein